MSRKMTEETMLLGLIKHGYLTEISTRSQSGNTIKRLIDIGLIDYNKATTEVYKATKYTLYYGLKISSIES